MTEVQEIEIRKGVYGAVLNISKEQWLELLQDDTVVGNSMPTLLRFYRAAEHKGTCKDVNPDSPYYENNHFWQFGRRVGNKLNIKIIKPDGNQNYWTIPAKEGRSLPNGFEWTLRDELVDAIRDWLILDLLKRYKGKFLNVALKGPYKDGEQADELYKWQLLTDCDGKTSLEIIQHFKTKNIVDARHVNQVLTNLLKEKPQQLSDTFDTLKNDEVPLYNRLLEFKNAMDNLCGDKYNVKANDERTAAAFLACWNPQQYTFYKDEIYQNYCTYIGEQTQKAGQKYPHYLQLLNPLVQAIKQDNELTDKYTAETNGLIQSDLLIAQNILWQMKDLMVETDFSFKDLCREVKLKLDNSDFRLGKPKKDFVWIDAPYFDAKEECHYELCCDIDDKANHNGKTVFVEVHFEKNNHTKFEEAIEDIETIQSFPWHKGYGFRINNEGYAMIGDKAEVAEKAINELYELDNLIGKTIKQIINNMSTNSEIEKFAQLLKLKQNLILQGAPGTGKTYNTAALALSICGVNDVDLTDHKAVMERYGQMCYDKDKNPDGQIGFCTFHQSMDYEDFVEGIKPLCENGSTTYNVEDGIFKNMSKTAEKNLVKNYVLIIDEINRGNVSRIFGELITLLEADKRIGINDEKNEGNKNLHTIQLTLPYSKESFGVPENLYIIGTMNTTDRSVGNIDYAVRRRFAFATLQSKRDLVVAHSTEKAAVLFDAVKSFIEKNKTEMDFEDLMVGHSYFFAENDDELELRWQYEILPLLNEYIKDDILRAERLKSDMNDFIEKWCVKSENQPQQ